MKKLVSLSLCLSLNLFVVARAMKPGQILAVAGGTCIDKIQRFCLPIKTQPLRPEPSTL
jgi:hypothetical protein